MAHEAVPADGLIAVPKKTFEKSVGCALITNPEPLWNRCRASHRADRPRHTHGYGREEEATRGGMASMASVPTGGLAMPHFRRPFIAEAVKPMMTQNYHIRTILNLRASAKAEQGRLRSLGNRFAPFFGDRGEGASRLEDGGEPAIARQNPGDEGLPDPAPRGNFDPRTEKCDRVVGSNCLSNLLNDRLTCLGSVPSTT